MLSRSAAVTAWNFAAISGVRISGRSNGSVIINPATGVAARYYHYYARFLAEHGFDVLTYDYRGIGLSRPERLRAAAAIAGGTGVNGISMRRCFSWKASGPASRFSSSDTVSAAFCPGSAHADRIDAHACSRRAIWEWRRLCPRAPLAAAPEMASFSCQRRRLLFGYFPGGVSAGSRDLPKGTLRSTGRSSGVDRSSSIGCRKSQCVESPLRIFTHQS